MTISTSVVLSAVVLGNGFVAELSFLSEETPVFLFYCVNCINSLLVPQEAHRKIQMLKVEV